MNQQQWNKGLYVNGEWLTLDEKIPVQNPATLEIIGSVPDGSVTEAKLAVDAAHKAFEAWSKTTAYERAALLERWHQVIESRLDEIAYVMTMEQGKPLAEAKGEVQYANSYIKWYAEEAKRIYGEMIPASSGSKRILVQKQPVGVVAAVTPWNFPAAMITRKIAPALAAGCTTVTKPAEQTPLTALLLAECAHEAGIPAGVINIVTTSKAGEVVDVWLDDSRVKKITFTGSTPVGKLLMRKAADTVKKISLELGGLAPFIVAEDANIEAAVKGLIQSKFRNAGQTCICANRIYVHENVKAPFLQALTQAVEKLRVGKGTEDKVEIGPLIDDRAVQKVQDQIDDAITKGATLHGSPVLEGSTGYFMKPVVLSDVTDEMICMQEETFGPIAPVSTFADDQEVIQRANATPYGLAAYVFTQSLTKAFYFSESLEYGIVGVNDGGPSVAQAPFGGMKESGLGREGSHHGIEEYLEVKYISLQFV
ncbi:NAD-dependent succinate-semialdehyde dehydrogenase [Brevibacillus reuszeri]|uniref:NAD-dependent succinate-semialdehyde dehydrogenase n=1 Tax=Brevibacillus reuszeri TaxID=54915 RepID=UPI001B11EEDA|nr:NAD-dependent succinate-semialdehyde dehydrogenase [Brevibacillus reuszeri]GIO04451.1 NAD-dependent succinate-semialdehyde dehydrogenase [Brevibacillus reuszeri]